MSAALRPARQSGAPDTARRKRAQRRGRERGCWVYIDAEQLQRSGIDPHDAPPFYMPRGYHDVIKIPDGDALDSWRRKRGVCVACERIEMVR